MKKLLFIMLLLGVCVMRAQTYQQTEIELDSEIPKDKSFVYEASTSIKMLKGFHCQPKGKNSVMFAIDRFGVFPPEEGITGGASALSQDGVVGALPGELNVGNLGAAEYSVPILLPQGIGNMTPEIAVIPQLFSAGKNNALHAESAGAFNIVGIVVDSKSGADLIS